MKKILIVMVFLLVVLMRQSVMAVEWPKDVPLPSEIIYSSRQGVQNIIQKFGLKPGVVVNKPGDSLLIYRSKSEIEMDIFFRAKGIEVVYVFPTQSFSIDDLVAIPGFGKYPFRLSEMEYCGTGKNLEWKAQVRKPKFVHPSGYIQILGVSAKHHN